MTTNQQEISVTISHRKLAEKVRKNDVVNTVIYIVNKLKDAGVPVKAWTQKCGIEVTEGSLAHRHDPSTQTSTYIWRSSHYNKDWCSDG